MSYKALVSAPSEDVPTMSLVEPDSLDDSYMWHKIKGTHVSVGGSGVSMPKGTKTVSASEVSDIEQWILDGALE